MGPLNKDTAKQVLTDMKGQNYLVEGRKEKFESFSIHPTTFKVMLMTDKQTRWSALKDLHLHLDIYQQVPAAIAAAVPSAATIKSKSLDSPLGSGGAGKPGIKLPAHVGESKDKILFTTDYSLFKKMLGNRSLNYKKIEKIKGDIQKGLDFLPYCPIVVDADYNVVDGQHRLQVAKELKAPVYFIICRRVTIQDVAKVNSRTERWKTIDFATSYAEQGSSDYEQLTAFCSKYKLPLSTGLALLGSTVGADKGSARHKSKFEDGTYKVTQLERATRIMDTALRFSQFTRYKSRPFIDAVTTLLFSITCDMERMVKKFNDNTTLLTAQINAKNYLVALEVIYNKGKSSREHIY